jgi:ribose transport system substrate-binding protein
MKKTHFFAIATSLASVALFGLQASQAQSKTYVIGMAQANNAEPWREAMNAQLTSAAKKAGMQLTIADARQDNSKQVADVERFIQQKVDLLIISPNEAAPLTAVVKRAYDGGIPVIVLDRAVLGDAYTMFIGADNKLIGEKAGTYVGKWCRENKRVPCNVLEITGLSGSPPSADRGSGFRKGLALNRNAKIIASPTSEWLREKAVAVAAAAFQANAKIDVVYGHNDPSTEGGYLAAKNAGKDLSKILFVGIDALPSPDGGIMAVIEGRLGASYVYPTGSAEAIEWAGKILTQGAKPPKKVVLGTTEVYPSNAMAVCKKYECPAAK